MRKYQIITFVFFLLAISIYLSAEIFPSQAGYGMPDEYEIVFEDEFNGGELDSAHWSIPPRGNSTWSRWISAHSEVLQIRNGSLVCRAIPNKDRLQDTATMLTGAIWSKDKLSFKYGKVEVRMKTNLQKGNFPAAWMGRQWGPGYVPPYGEIDIVEMVGDKKEARHAFHTEYTTKTKKHGIKNSFITPVNVNKWHVYSIEWTPDYIFWYVDNVCTGRHYKSAADGVESQNSWTFDVPFYLLLNQSIMHGVYGIKADFKKTYETHFDWVRVYQKQ